MKESPIGVQALNALLLCLIAGQLTFQLCWIQCSVSSIFCVFDRYTVYMGAVWLSWKLVCLLWQLSGFESSHLSKLQNSHQKEKNIRYIAHKKIKKYWMSNTTWGWKFKELLRNKTKVHLRLSWGSVHGSHCSNIELAGVKLSVPIMCMPKVNLRRQDLRLVPSTRND